MNLLMKRIGPNITFPLMVVLWGMVSASQGPSSVSEGHWTCIDMLAAGAVKSYAGLLVCRFFLGVVEG